MLILPALLIEGGGRNLNIDFGTVERQEGVRPQSMSTPPAKDWTPYPGLDTNSTGN